MKTNVKCFGKYEYIYNPNLQAGYYSPLEGWHLLKSNGILYYNYDPLGELFFNKL
jgi:hypothetical protein